MLAASNREHIARAGRLGSGPALGPQGATEMTIQRFNSGQVVPATVPFPEGVRVGNMLYLSGQLGNVPGQLKL
eukprot:gene20986-25720_t